jgi:integrase
MKFSVHVKCACPEGQKCPQLWRKDGSWNSRHGSAGFATRIPTSQGVRPLKRFGYPSKTEAQSAAEAAGTLIDLGTDDATRQRIGDMIAAAKRGVPLPAAADVARRIGIGADPASSGETFGQAWVAWMAGKKRLRPSSRRRLEQIGAHWLLPAIGDVALERLNGGHCAGVFERVERINTEVTAARAEGRQPRPDGDVRIRPQVIGIASQHRIYAALREVLNHAWRKRHVITFNPCYAIELEAEETPEAQRWSAGQAARFIAASAGDPLGLLFRIMILRGQRRGEMVGARWADVDWDAGTITIDVTLLQLGGKITPGKPKTRTSSRTIFLDAASLELLKALHAAQLRARMKAGAAWQDHGLIFCRADGTPFPPDYVSRRFKAIAKAAGLPVIKLHEGGRHTAASLGDDAGVDAEIRQRTLGHATAAMTAHYTHPEAARFRQAAEDVAAYVEGAGS